MQSWCLERLSAHYSGITCPQTMLTWHLPTPELSCQLRDKCCLGHSPLQPRLSTQFFWAEDSTVETHTVKFSSVICEKSYSLAILCRSFEGERRHVTWWPRSCVRKIRALSKSKSRLGRTWNVSKSEHHDVHRDSPARAHHRVVGPLDNSRPCSGGGGRKADVVVSGKVCSSVRSSSSSCGTSTNWPGLK